MIRSHSIGNGLCHNAQVIKSKAVRYDGAPAVGAKMYGHVYPPMDSLMITKVSLQNEP
jgi:hypothetical protein